MSEDIHYWRTLALERQREIEALRARLLALLERTPDAHFHAVAAALRQSGAPWVHTLDTMITTAAVEPDDVTIVLEDLWRRVAAE